MNEQTQEKGQNAFINKTKQNKTKQVNQHFFAYENKTHSISTHNMLLPI